MAARRRVQPALAPILNDVLATMILVGDALAAMVAVRFARGRPALLVALGLSPLLVPAFFVTTIALRELEVARGTAST